MSAWALYHDNDELKCEVVREAIMAKAITDGEVICGDIKQLAASDVRGFRRAHFFCGGGFWDLVLNLAGWGDEPVWTGSCPCPSFSSAGKGDGFDDPRHLWPDWFRLISECKPAAIFGEQADDAVGYGWLDLVQADLEAEDYAVGKAILGAASVGAPHIRQRIYFCADAEAALRRRAGQPSIDGRWPSQVGRSGNPGNGADSDGRVSGDGDLQRSGQHGLFAADYGTGVGTDAYGESSERRTRGILGTEAPLGGAWLFNGNRSDGPADGGEAIGRANPLHTERGPQYLDGNDGRDRKNGGRTEAHGVTGAHGKFFVGQQSFQSRLEGHTRDEREWRGPGWLDPEAARSIAETGATRGFWHDCDWWYGRDGKYRPIGPGLFPLAHGSTARVGRLRMYGDAICIPTATAFVQAYLEARGIAA